MLWKQRHNSTTWIRRRSLRFAQLSSLSCLHHHCRNCHRLLLRHHQRNCHHLVSIIIVTIILGIVIIIIITTKSLAKHMLCFMIIFKMVTFCLNMNGFIFTWFDLQCANPGWTLSICFSSLAYWAEWACTNKDIYKALTNTTTKTMTKTNAYKTVWQVLFLIEQTELLSSAPMVFSINPPPLWYNKEWWHWDRMMLNIQWSSP